MRLDVRNAYAPARKYAAFRGVQVITLSPPSLEGKKKRPCFESSHSTTGVLENRDKLLNHMVVLSRRPGNTVTYDSLLDYPVIDVENRAEFDWHLKATENAGLIERPGGGIHRLLTEMGWNYLMGPSGGGAIPGRCFVAMSFSEEHAAIYSEGIEPAVHDAGYEPVWMKNVLTNEDICYRMIREIRSSQFLVADLTGLKSGVYFEGGLAIGFGRPVFWTCQAGEMKYIHFDTNHYQPTVWNTHEDLRLQLAEKIEAVLGVGPNRTRRQVR